MKTIKKITWRHIESLKWGLTFDYKSIAQNLWKTYDFDTIDRMRTFAMDKYKQLHKKYLAACLKKHDTVGGVFSDDSLSDAIYHVIGLGQQEYEKVMNNLALLERRAEHEGYKESFAYCFQKPDRENKELLLDDKIGQLCEDEGVPSVLLSIAIYCEDQASSETGKEKERWTEDAEAIGALQKLIRRN